MPQDRSKRDSGRSRPSLLEPELSAQVEESEGLLTKGYLPNPDEIVVVFELAFNFFPGPFDSMDLSVQIVNERELPVRCQVMGCTEYSLLVKCIVWIEEIIPKPYAEIASDVPYISLSSLPFFAIIL